MRKIHENTMSTPILKILKKYGNIDNEKLINILKIEYYNDVPQELLEEKYKSGGDKFRIQVNAIKRKLAMANYIENNHKYENIITKKGLNALKNGKTSYKYIIKDKLFIKNKKLKNNNKKIGKNKTITESDTKQEKINKIYNTKLELINIMNDISIYNFTKIVNLLIKNLGYNRISKVNQIDNNNINYIIYNDTLGFDKIYINSMYSKDGNISKNDIIQSSSFINSNTYKGIFITNAYLNSNDIKIITDTKRNIIIIDQNKLIDLMIEFNIGINEVEVYKIIEIDNNFFKEDDK